MQELTREDVRTSLQRIHDVLVDDYNKVVKLESKGKFARNISQNPMLILQSMVNLNSKIIRNELLTREEIMGFIEDNNLDCLRFCDKCGKPMWEGYITPNMERYCGYECLEMTEEEVEEQYTEEEDCIFYTEWL